MRANADVAAQLTALAQDAALSRTEAGKVHKETEKTAKLQALCVQVRRHIYRAISSPILP
jgi:hypothetical protein